LFEELLTEEERSGVLGDSGHEKIFIAKVEEVDGEKLEKDVRELEKLAKEMDSEGIVRKLQEMVPSYRPNRGMLKGYRLRFPKNRKDKTGRIKGEA